MGAHAPKLRFCLIGAGRIGRLHAANLVDHPRARLASVVDQDGNAAADLAEAHQATASTAPLDALAANAIDAVIVASPSSSHFLYVHEALEAGKPVLCEKPLASDPEDARTLAALSRDSGIAMMTGFNRRFDANHARLQERLARGEIGSPHLVCITSRDPEPPRYEYLANEKGALFTETMVHDLDMARWLLGEEPVRVAAFASNLVEPRFAELGEVDTAVAILTTASGRMARIDNSWGSAYGYDQRIEVFGQGGMLQSGNVQRTTVELHDQRGPQRDPVPYFFLDRYRESYRTELDSFIAAVLDRQPVPVSGLDGWRATLLAGCVMEAAKSGRIVEVPPPD
ncbi:inositol 2-dehydrogenase [Geminicoccus roseus]|uniref:inositol 2-dehydrogenase n=1 Tax=Geminicoccus roseus TaxID=404900 RepID=UPI000403741C|nr:inositol 2-dehydrogenase [Geminicoccus roseus]